MLPEERRQRILEELAARGLVRVDDLVTQLDVSAETVRRDLIELERRNELTRVYGGATRNADAPARSAERRDVANPEAKRAIAQLAVTLIRPHQTIIFDVGSTVLEVARALPMDLVAQALTNSGYTAQELARRPHVQIHLAGGEVRPEDLACSGQETEEFIGGFFADVAFLCAGGVHPQAGITDFFPREIAVRRHMLQRSTARYVLADSTKLGRVALRRVCELNAVTAVITDSDAPPDLLETIAARGIAVMVAPIGPAADPQDTMDGQAPEFPGGSITLAGPDPTREPDPVRVLDSVRAVDAARQAEMARQAEVAREPGQARDGESVRQSASLREPGSGRDAGSAGEPAAVDDPVSAGPGEPAEAPVRRRSAELPSVGVYARADTVLTAGGETVGRVSASHQPVEGQSLALAGSE